MSGPACAHGRSDRLADRSDRLINFLADGGAQASHETIQDKGHKAKISIRIWGFLVNKT